MLTRTLSLAALRYYVDPSRRVCAAGRGRPCRGRDGVTSRDTNGCVHKQILGRVLVPGAANRWRQVGSVGAGRRCDPKIAGPSQIEKGRGPG
jgi:hypothetical protein